MTSYTKEEIEKIIKENEKLKRKNNLLKQKNKELKEKNDDYIFDVVSNAGFDESEFDEEHFQFEEWICKIKETIDNYSKIHKEKNEEIKKLKEKVEKKRLQKVKLKNDLEIANMLYIDDIREQIDDSIYKGINQITIYCGKNFYKEHKLNYIKEYVIKELTTYTNGDSQYSCYRNGYYYLKGDCMSPYEVEYNDDGTFCFNRVESESEEEEESDSE